MIQLSHQAISLGVPGLKSAQSIVDYAIASHTAAPWVMGVTVGDALLALIEHCSLMLTLTLAAPLAPSVSALPTLHIHWELGAQVC